jgi:hypothetical protein
MLGGLPQTWIVGGKSPVCPLADARPENRPPKRPATGSQSPGWHSAIARIKPIGSKPQAHRDGIIASVVPGSHLSGHIQSTEQGGTLPTLPPTLPQERQTSQDRCRNLRVVCIGPDLAGRNQAEPFNPASARFTDLLPARIRPVVILANLFELPPERRTVREPPLTPRRPDPATDHLRSQATAKEHPAHGPALRPDELGNIRYRPISGELDAGENFGRLHTQRACQRRLNIAYRAG